MEEFRSQEKPVTVESRLEQMRDARLAVSNLVQSKITKEQFLSFSRSLAEKFPKALGPEERKILEQLSFDDFEDFVGGIAQQYANMETFEINDIPPVSIDAFKNIENYRQVEGYGHPDLLARQQANPVPTAEELLMGCYIEQIERQTRSSVLLLRQKGYNTVESGYENKFTGSQYFHLTYTPEISIPPELIASLENDFGTSIQIRHETGDTEVEIISSKFKDLDQWKECLDYFAENMPVIGKENYAPVGGAVDFSLEMIERFPLEEILKSAKNDTEIALVKKLYDCKNKEEVDDLREKGLEG